MSRDSLEFPSVLPWSDVPHLIKLYEDSEFDYYGSYLILDNFNRWHESSPEVGVYVLCPNGKIDEHGTFVVFFLENFNIIFDTKNPDPLEMKSFLEGCVQVLFNRQETIVFGPIRKKLWPVLEETVSNFQLKCLGQSFATSYHMEKDEAKQLTSKCPDDVYVDVVQEKHIDLIDSLWPHRFEGSKILLRTVIRLNGGIGIFLKESHELVAWALHGHYNGPGFLQTVDAYMRRGYGQLAAVEISKFLANKGMDSYLYIVKGNTPSLKLYSGLKYKEHQEVQWSAYSQS